MEDPTILSAAKSGNQLETLKTLRDKLAQTLDSTQSARDIAPLAKRFADTLEEIARLEKEQSKGAGTVIGEILEGRQ